jgi:two-component system sensor histidine kinase KdpD
LVVVATRYGLGPSLWGTCVSVAALDFFFVAPLLTFAVADFKHTVTFAVMFLVAVVISALTQRVKKQAHAAHVREERIRALYSLTRELNATLGHQHAVEVSAAHIEHLFDSLVTVLVPNTAGQLERRYASPSLGEMLDREVSVAQWVWSNHKEAGLGTNTLPSVAAFYLPLSAAGNTVGVLGIAPSERHRFDDIEQRRHLRAFASQLAAALERSQLFEATENARREVEAEQLRNALLSSVSHDLRTPLAVITGTASTLLEGAESIDPTTRVDLTKSILDGAERLNRLIRNLLDMTKLESGTVKVKKEWSSIEEVVGSALTRLDARLRGRPVQVKVPMDLPLMAFDPLLIEQVLINLLENAAKYSDGPIDVFAFHGADEAMVEIADHGAGIPPGEETRIFEKFHRAVREGGPSGVGLGLAICRAIITAHSGKLWAQNREGGGASFRFVLPRGGEPPQLPIALQSVALACEAAP